MKQYITEEQLNKLTTNAKIKLKNWCISKSPHNKSYDETKINIGQMIEFLDKYHGAWSMESWQEWEIINQEDNKNMIISKNKELCDALWEAVMEMLENGS